MFKDVKTAVEWIESIKKFGSKLDLSRMNLACERLGHPEQSIKTIHVAGTNGKGSTVSFLKSILMENGYTVGTYTSPYIVSFNERISINDTPINDADLLKYINQVNSLYNELCDEFGMVVTFFECVTLISFLYNKDKQPDFVIYEVGLGGTLDATNVISPILTAITSISYDHMGVLGDTLESIALNKLGIVKDNIPLITTVHQKELLPLFHEVTNNHHSELTLISQNDITISSSTNKTSFTYQDNSYTTGLNGMHQPYNAVLALSMAQKLEALGYVTLKPGSIQKGLENTRWPGRMETFGNVVMDGAHNIGGVKALEKTLKAWNPKKVHILFTAMADKEIDEMIQVLDTLCDTITFTEFPYPRCDQAINLYNHSQHKHKYQKTDAKEALRELILKYPNDLIVVTGSLYFISYIRPEVIQLMK